MFEKLSAVESRYEQLCEKMSQPEIVSDTAVFTEIMKEQSSLAPIVEKYREYKAAKQNEAEAEEILNSGNADKEFKELAAEELEEAKKAISEISEELRILLLPKDPNDQKNVIVEIRAGTGGEEAALFAAALFRMYSMYAGSKNFGIEITNANETELGGYKEISFMIEGKGAYSKFKYESGTHRVQRVPDTETQGRIHTSAVTVAVMPEADEVEIDINPADLKIDTYRSSGAGGQHINKTSSAIRITHLPTNTVVECQDERSQFKNREKAMRVLRARLFDAAKSEHDEAIAADRRAQVGSGDRSERIRTYNYPQGRVTDHRIGLTLYRLFAVLDGDLDEIINALTAFYRTKEMNEQNESS